MRRRLTTPALAAATALLAAAVLPALGGSAGAVEPTPAHVPVAALEGALPAWAHGTPASLVAGTERVDAVVQLATRHRAELKRVVAAVSDPASPDYRHFLTHGQYAARYAPTAASLSAVRGYLRGAGLSVDAVTSYGTLLQVHGTAAAVGRVFGTTFGRFDVDGLSLRAPLSVPSLPSALIGTVANVAGLAESAPLTPGASPSPVFLNARPCGKYYGQTKATKQPGYEGTKQAYAVCGYTGKQLRTAYGVDQTKAKGQKLTGKGATVGIVDAYASPTILKDANTYAAKHGDKKFAAGQYTENTQPGQTELPEDPTGLLLDPQGWAGEETLDVEAVHAMAPDAKVIYQAATSPLGPFLYVALDQLVEAGKVQVISNSYGTAADSPDLSDKTLFDQITDTAASTGITIDFSSGDDGDETDPSADGSRTADFPATSPGVTAVGGTSLHVDKKGHMTGETYWGTRKDVQKGSTWDFKNVVYSGAGGGGVSTTYDEPAWQKKVVPAKLTTIGRSTPGRVEPDISMVADSTTGFLTGQTQTFADGSVKYSEYRIGGTSLSCPLFSGVLALAVGARHGKGLGLVTPTLYAGAKSPKTYQTLYHDPAGVTVDKKTHQSEVANVRPDYTDPTDPTSTVTYSLRTLGNLATLHRLKGYDDSTGLGSPKVPALVAKLVAKK